eukprot:2817378-Lingulodinium_polyedra.AAC.1
MAAAALSSAARLPRVVFNLRGSWAERRKAVAHAEQPKLERVRQPQFGLCYTAGFCACRAERAPLGLFHKAV